MANSKAVDKAKSTDVADLPDLVPTPSMFDEIGSDDVALARLKMGQHMSEQVQEKEADYGDIYTVMSKDDMNPTILWEFGDGKGELSDNRENGLVFHVVDMYRGKSWTDENDKLQLFDYADPNAPEDAWVTYNYFVSLEYDPELPVKLILSRTGRQSAQMMNTVMKKAQHRGPAYITAFELTTKKTSNEKGKFCVPQVRQVEADPARVQLASKHAAVLQGRPDIKAANSSTDAANEPGI